MSAGDKHAIVVGGGVIGICCAYFLALRGVRVTVLERGEVCQGASFGNAGTIAPGHGPINKPGRIRQALLGMFDPLNPLHIPPRWDPALARWLWSFSRHCNPKHVEAGMRVLAPLGHATKRLFDRIVAEERIDCGYRAEGYYEVYRTAGAFDHAKKEAALVRAHGYDPEVVSGGALREREPLLRKSVIGGVFYPEAATCDPSRFVLGLAQSTRQRGGEIRTQSEVTEILTAAGRVRGVRMGDGSEIVADAVILATGAYSLELLARLGRRIPLQAGKGYHSDLGVGEGGAPQLGITCMLGETSVFCTPMNGVVRFAGTLEFSGVNHEIRRSRLQQLTVAADQYLLGMGSEEPQSEWCGLRPCTSDGLPVVGPVSGCDGLLVATGHAMLGLTLGPVTGQLIADYVLDGTPSIDITALGLDRF